MISIDTPTEAIAAEYTRWRNNRDAVAGVYKVKAAGERYLSKPYAAMSAAEYESFKRQVSWYPAVARTNDGIVGLMMRKVPALEGAGLLSDIHNIITRDGRTIDELTRDVVRETLITNYTGLLVDVPQGRARNQAEAIAQNLRPFIGLYPAESILEVTPGVVNNRRVPVRVRLLENNGDQVRELRLNAAGEYEVVLHVRTQGGEWTQSVVKPLLDGVPMRELPFVLVSTTGGYEPRKAPLDDAVALNYDHYNTQALIKTIHLHSASPMLVATGVQAGQEEKINISPGFIMCLENSEAKVEFIEIKGDSLPSLERDAEKIEDRLAVVGARILARQKAVAEAAETEALRQGAENASLANIANAISRCIKNALVLVSKWNGDGEDVAFAITTDFTPVRASAQEMTALLGLYQADAISEETFFFALRDRGVLDQTLTIEEERKRKAEGNKAAKPEPVVVNNTAPTPDA